MPDHSDDHDVIDVLVTDHEEARELIGELLGGGSVEERKDKASQLVAELARHSVVEEMHVYPVMKHHVPGGDGMVEHDQKEHNELEQALSRLEKADPADEQAFLGVVREVQRLLEDHARDEEEEQFPKLREHVSPERLKVLKKEVELSKKVAPTRPHPNAPNTELFHKLFGPGVGLVDKVRDALGGRSTG